ncbi:MAG TPA: hypothetical protein VFC60_01630 [Tissierellaceae bacterium]|nr:hypothetical protein [Tissierellaceae bacterium]
MTSKNDLYSNKIFLNAVLPLIKVIVEEDPGINKAFKGKSGKVQISALTEEEKVGTHYLIENGEVEVKLGITEKPDLELEFNSIESFNGFFKGTSKKLPKIKGIKNLGLLIATLRALLKMSALLGATSIPETEEEKDLLVKLYFYLLSSGISQLNKVGHPDVSKWVKRSPDRVYAWAVDGKPDLAAYLRVKAGNSRSARGQYTRSKPFFTMRFDSTESALGILLDIDDMLESTIDEKLIMEGAPEFGAQIGEYMLMVGAYAK